MSNDDPHSRGLITLKAHVAASLAFEEEMLASLSDGAVLMHSQGLEARAREVEDQIRRHRVSIIKHRAIMAAQDIKA